MDLVAFLALLLMLYFVYTLTESYKSLRNELREIRLKCVAPGAATKEGMALSAPEAPASPVEAIKGQVLSGLVTLASKTSYSPAPAGA